MNLDRKIAVGIVVFVVAFVVVMAATGQCNAVEAEESEDSRAEPQAAQAWTTVLVQQERDSRTFPRAVGSNLRGHTRCVVEDGTEAVRRISTPHSVFVAEVYKDREWQRQDTLYDADVSLSVRIRQTEHIGSIEIGQDVMWMLVSDYLAVNPREGSEMVEMVEVGSCVSNLVALAIGVYKKGADTTPKPTATPEPRPTATPRASFTPVPTPSAPKRPECQYFHRHPQLMVNGVKGPPGFAATGCLKSPEHDSAIGWHKKPADEDGPAEPAKETSRPVAPHYHTH